MAHTTALLDRVGEPDATATPLPASTCWRNTCLKTFPHWWVPLVRVHSHLRAHAHAAGAPQEHAKLRMVVCYFERWEQAPHASDGPPADQPQPRGTIHILR